MGKFLIAAEMLLKSEADTLTSKLREAGYGYWHWVDNVWLVQTDTVSSAKALHDVVVAAVPSLEPKTVVVMRLDDPKSYWGKATKEGWDWLKTHDWGTAT